MDYHQRNALASSKKPVLPPVPVLTGKPVDGGFATLEHVTMGTLGTPADGFLSLLAPLVAGLSIGPAILGEMDGSAGAAVFIPGAAAKQYFDPIDVQVRNLVPAGDALLQEFGQQFPGSVPTPPPPKGPGGGPGHGGGGPGGGTGPGPTCGHDHSTVLIGSRKDPIICVNPEASLQLVKVAPSHVIPPWKPKGKPAPPPPPTRTPPPQRR